MADTKELQVKEKQEVATTAEQTQPGLVFTPVVDIFESDHGITVMADMPGASSENISIDLKENILTISGEVKPWEGPKEQDVLVEFEIGKYFRQFTLSQDIDRDRIQAAFQDGVLRLVLPKAENAVPRKIVVTAS